MVATFTPPSVPTCNVGTPLAGVRWRVSGTGARSSSINTSTMIPTSRKLCWICCSNVIWGERRSRSEIMHALTPTYSFRSPAQISKTTPLSCHPVFSITEYLTTLPKMLTEKTSQAVKKCSSKSVAIWHFLRILLIQNLAICLV